MQMSNSFVSHKRNNKNIVKCLFCLTLFFLFLRNLTLITYKSNNLTNVKNKSSNVFLYNKARGVPYNPISYSLKVDFASEESGTKIVAQSSSLTQLSNIQTSDRNTYMLAPCQTTDWYVLSFQESILVEQICFLSYEYYASTYRHIRISASDVFPATKWRLLANIETKSNINEIFNISQLCKNNNSDCWTKFMKVELLDYHTVEDNYYCSITTMEVYGKTAVEVLENEITNDNDELSSDTKAVNRKNYNSLHPDISFSPPSTSLQASTSSALELKSCKIFHPTFIYDMKMMINESLLKLLFNIAFKSDPLNVNKSILFRVVKITRIKRLYICKNRLHFKCIIKILLFASKNPFLYTHILHGVMLPINHTWFDSIIYRFIRGTYNSTHNLTSKVGIKEAPILICLQSKGFISKYACYSYSNLKSFPRLIYNKFMIGFNINTLYYVEIFHLMYVNGKKTVKSPRQKNINAGKKYSMERKYHIIDDNISSIVVKGNNLTVFFGKSDVGRAHRSLKSLFKSNDFITTISKYIATQLKGLPSRKDGNAKLFTGSNVFINETCLEEDEEDGEIDRTNVRQSNGRSGHVLIKISERIKLLELITNQLSGKLYENDKLLNSYFAHSVDGSFHPKHLDTIPNTIDEWKTAMREMHETISMLGIQRKVIIFRRNHKIDPRYETFLARDLNNKYTSRILYNNDKLNNVCNLMDCSHNFKRLKLSKTNRMLNRFLLLDYCSIHGCSCTKKIRRLNTLLLWMPHFSKRRKPVLFDTIRALSLYILSVASLIINLVFNTCTLMIVFTSIQWYWFIRYKLLERRLKFIEQKLDAKFETK